MTIGILRCFLYLPDSDSLKAKRMILHSLKAKLRNKFNIAIAQVDDQDKWQKATVACVGIEPNGASVNETLSEVVNYMQAFPGVLLLDYEIELL
ncbi:MAG: DUF503 domain-containing protein [Candidatus Omnitrophica bacterium]|nr:DUF503 domain-containing protein [Candidatus Omnitrophota bacterium]